MGMLVVAALLDRFWNYNMVGGEIMKKHEILQKLYIINNLFASDELEAFKKLNELMKELETELDQQFDKQATALLFKTYIEEENLQAKLEKYEKALKEIESINEYYSGSIAGKALDNQ